MAILSKKKALGATGVSLFLLALVSAIENCSGDSQTGLWIRILCPNIPIDRVTLDIFDAVADSDVAVDSGDFSLGLAKKYTESALEPENQIWVMVTAGDVVNQQISIHGIGFRNGRMVVEGELKNLAFSPGEIIQCASCTLILDHSGTDADLDGYYVPDDCDDGNRDVYPGARELCDGKDYNCDNANDDGCSCTEGTPRECWPHWAGRIECNTAESSCPCRSGIQSCVSGAWGTCDSLVLPSPEGGSQICEDGTFNCYPSCNDGIDNDCDGYIDLKDRDCGGCDPQKDDPRACYTGPEETRGKGRCQDGVQSCQEDGTWSGCQGEVTPQPEKCDREDWDCNGTAGDYTADCPKQAGVCKGAKWSCVNFQLAGCDDAGYLQHSASYVAEETTQCDQLDNDCDGTTDDLCECSPNGRTRSYGSDILECRVGVETCIDGKWVVTTPAVEPTDEHCDGLNSNCNDQKDDTDPAATLDCLASIPDHAVLDGCKESPPQSGIWKCVWVCSSNYWDLNQDLQQPGGNGCEYPCTLTAGQVERCDQQDNNCDGNTDADDPNATASQLCPSRNNTYLNGTTPQQVCVNGQCQYECNGNWGDCNNDRRDPVPLPGYPDNSNGCETYLLDNNSNCGQCGQSCNQNASCQGTACTCQGNWDNCSGGWADGCETPLGTNSDCGSCDDTCGSASYCNGTSCANCNLTAHCGANCQDCAPLGQNKICVLIGGTYQCGCSASEGCVAPQTCYNQQCCQPNCSGKCGTADNGCGSPCNTNCPDGSYCNNGSCDACTINAHCGSGCDNCTTLDQNKICVQRGSLYQCGCSSTAGCLSPQTCYQQQCCQPASCAGKCPPTNDGCGSDCPGCTGATYCANGICEACNTDTKCGPTCTDCTSQPRNQVCVDISGVLQCGCKDANQDCGAGEQCSSSLCACGSGPTCSGTETCCTDHCTSDFTRNPDCGACNVDCSVNQYDKACVDDQGSYRCGCISIDDCGDGRQNCDPGTFTCY